LTEPKLPRRRSGLTRSDATTRELRASRRVRPPDADRLHRDDLGMPGRRSIAGRGPCASAVDRYEVKAPDGRWMRRLALVSGRMVPSSVWRLDELDLELTSRCGALGGADGCPTTSSSPKITGVARYRPGPDPPEHGLLELLGAHPLQRRRATATPASASSTPAAARYGCRHRRLPRHRLPQQAPQRIGTT